MTNLSVLCILIEMLSRAHSKGKKEKKKSLNNLKLGTVLGPFPRDGAASKAVKGLNWSAATARRITHNHTDLWFKQKLIPDKLKIQ